MTEQFEDPIIGNTVTVYHAIQVLNEALALDHKAIECLFAPMVPCNIDLANSNSVESFAIQDSSYAITPLSILNAIFAYSAQDSYYRIFPVYGENNQLIEFRLGIVDNDNT